MPFNEGQRRSTGFTLIELVLVIVLLGVLAAFALPRFADLSREARIAALDSVEGTMKSTIGIVKAKARAQGLSPASANPGGSSQTGYVIETEAGSAEVDWRNLCPESQAELEDNLTMLDYLSIDENTSRFETRVSNRSTWVGFDIPDGLSPDPADNNSGRGCYVQYDSFGDPNCTTTKVTTDC